MDLMSALQFLKLQEISQGDFLHVIQKYIDNFLFLKNNQHLISSNI